jgi:hypothetical protein
MSNAYLFYKSYEPSLVKAFEQSNFLPEVHPITHSDMIATGGSIHTSRIKLSFTAKTGPFIRMYIYIPGSNITEQHNLSENEQSAIELWLNSIHVTEASLKQRSNNKI